jgi:hypothetical protein
MLLEITKRALNTTNRSACYAFTELDSVCTARLPENSRLLEYKAVSLVDSFVTFQKEAVSSSRVKQFTIKLVG